MEIGKLNKRISILGMQEVENELNQMVMKEVVFANVWANVVVEGAKEATDAEKKVYETTYKVKIRFLKGLDSSMIVEYAGKRLNIQSVIDVEERHAEMEMICVERR